MSFRRRVCATTTLIALLAFAPPVRARPYRLITTRTPLTLEAGHFELGARYQGLLEGDGTLAGGLTPADFHQIAGTLRIGVTDWLELETEVSAIIFHELGHDSASIDPGDVKVAAQVRLLHEGVHTLGIYLGVTLPTGPADVDVLPPFFADGTLDVEGLLLYEIRPARPVRLVMDAGWVHDGTRVRGHGLPDFDVPDAFRYDAAVAIHAGSRLLVLLEVNGRYYTDKVITPVWTDNQHIVEVSPGLRLELVPRLVLEAGAGIAVTDAARAIYRVRAQAGLTYEIAVF
jgi:hypothetical protein